MSDAVPFPPRAAASVARCSASTTRFDITRLVAPPPPGDARRRSRHGWSASVRRSADRVLWRVDPTTRVVLSDRLTDAVDRLVVTSGAPPFAVTTEESARVLLVAGEFDAAAVGCFAAAAASLTDGCAGDVTVDLTETRFIDAAGLGALVGLRTALSRGGRRLWVRGCSARSSRVFVAGGLADLLPGGG